MVASSRRAERERALGMLYEAEVKEIAPAEVAKAVDGYAAEIMTGVAAAKSEIDRLIGDYSRGWDVERMPATDRAVLRIATWELLHRRDVPTAVGISEAVELAKRYSTDDSGRFVNGVLAAIADHVRPRR